MFYRMTWEEMVETLTGPRFFSLAYRVSAYQGVMSARHTAWALEAQSPTVGSATPPTSDVVNVGSTQGEIARSAVGDLFQMGRG